MITEKSKGYLECTEEYSKILNRIYNNFKFHLLRWKHHRPRANKQSSDWNWETANQAIGRYRVKLQEK